VCTTVHFAQNIGRKKDCISQYATVVFSTGFGDWKRQRWAKSRFGITMANLMQKHCHIQEKFGGDGIHLSAGGQYRLYKSLRGSMVPAANRLHNRSAARTEIASPAAVAEIRGSRLGKISTDCKGRESMINSDRKCTNGFRIRAVPSVECAVDVS